VLVYRMLMEALRGGIAVGAIQKVFACAASGDVNALDFYRAGQLGYSFPGPRPLVRSARDTSIPLDHDRRSHQQIVPR
jgi:hypothetical protein